MNLGYKKNGHAYLSLILFSGKEIVMFPTLIYIVSLNTIQPQFCKSIYVYVEYN
jgi:hypothetical protein